MKHRIPSVVVTNGEEGPMAQTDLQLQPARRADGAGSRWIDHWEPEDADFWANIGAPIARRNLIWSIAAEHIGFSVWLLWSAVVIYLPQAGFDFSINQLFWLVALPNLVGATLRFPYTFAVPRFGGRNWTVVSALLLMIPLGLLTACVANPDTPYWMFLVAAASAGLGGGNFASSMANISFFYPDKRKGTALGLNAAGGNIGVSSVQLLVPAIVGLAIVGSASGLHLENIALVWVPLALVAAAGAWFFMDNLTEAKSSFRDQVAVARLGQTWVMALLYVGTFGSFIGYSSALPLLMKTQFPDVHGVYFAFLGALVGSAFRPVGGWLADRVGGARITAAVFAAMTVGVGGVIWSIQHHVFATFLGSFLVLFVLTGLGNGSTYRMIPAIYRSLNGADSAAPSEPAMLISRTQTAAALGFISAVGAYGGFLVPRALGM
ncbi:MAG: transporter, family, nitrate/nitrite transporter, partial [Actinomycetota bacterium]|nr:transporter, family, nitrate/nitrite transporter [Actinomycetota bacterium]